MAYNGSGTFERLFNWVNDRDADIPITASRMDSEMDGMATGLSTAITKDGQTTITANLPMAGFRHTGVGNASARDSYAAAGQIQDGSLIYAVGGGTANAQTLTLAPSITEYTDGMVLNFEAGATNTGNTTLNVNSVGAQSVVSQNGAELPAGAITSGRFYTVIYDLTNTNWILANPSILNEFDIITANTTTNVFDIDADTLTTGNVIDITADALITGSIMNLVSNSADTGARSLVAVHNDNALATSTRCIEVIQDAPFDAIFIDQNGDNSSIEIDTEATTTNVIFINADVMTTGVVIDITADALTTGSGLRIASDSASGSARSLVDIIQDNASAGSARALNVQQDSAGQGIFVDMNGNGRSIQIDSEATTNLVIFIDADTLTSGDVINVTADALTTGKIFDLVSNSADTSTRELVTIHNDHASATNTKCLELIQDSIDNALYVYTNSASTSSKVLAFFHQDNSSAVNSTVIAITQDAASVLVNYAGNTGATTSNAITTLTTPGSIQGFIQVSINGTTRWMPFYDNPS